MTVENPFAYLDDMIATVPRGSDKRSEGAAHIRGIKQVMANMFPNFEGTTASPKAVTLSETDLGVRVATRTGDNVWTADQTFTSFFRFQGPSLRVANGFSLSGSAYITATASAGKTRFFSDGAAVFPFSLLYAEAPDFLEDFNVIDTWGPAMSVAGIYPEDPPSDFRYRKTRLTHPYGDTNLFVATYDEGLVGDVLTTNRGAALYETKTSTTIDLCYGGSTDYNYSTWRVVVLVLANVAGFDGFEA